MKEYTVEELGEIIAKHKKWIFGEDGGSRAYLYGAYLSGADLRGANGRKVNTILFVGGIGRERRMTTYWVEEGKV